MGEAQGAGVEGLAGAQGKAILDELLVFGVNGALPNLGAAVALVVEQGMADGSHVHANLVGSARLQAAFHHGDEAIALQHAPVRHRPFAFFGVIVDLEAQAVVGVPADGAFDGALVLGDIAPYHGGIDAVDGVDKELVGQVELRRRVFGHHQQAAGVFVDAVYQHAHALVFGVGLLLDTEVEGQGVDQGAVVIAMARMHHHAGGFVHHQHIFVFVNDVQGNVLGQNLEPAALVGHDELHHIAGPYYVVGLDGLVIHQHIAGFDGLLHAAAGGVFLMGCDELVYAHRLLAFVGHQPEMLEHFFLAGEVIGGYEVFRAHSCVSFPSSRVRKRLMAVPRGLVAPSASCLYTTAFTESA